MKKFIALVLAMTMVFSMAVVVSAESTTTLTTTVPAATYTLNIPVSFEKVSAIPMTGDTFWFLQWCLLAVGSTIGIGICLLHLKKKALQQHISLLATGEGVFMHPARTAEIFRTFAKI